MLRGSAQRARARALELLGQFPSEDVLWVGREPVARFAHVPPSGAKKLLGRSFDAVVIDLHDGVDADVLGQCHGMVWGGGALVLLAPDAAPMAGRERLAAHPYEPSDVGTHFWDRLERHLMAGAIEPTQPLAPPAHAITGSAEQRVVADALAARFTSADANLSVILADRGRGKSSGLGLAIRAALEARPELKVVVTAGQRSACAEVLRFCASDTVEYVAPVALSRRSDALDVIVIDEAAQLPVPLLRALVRAHPTSRIAFASTARGYEGTGRGFVLRFVEWLEREARPLVHLSLATPIRWDEGDELERLIFDTLLLDAEPAKLEGMSAIDTEHVVLDRDTLAADERRLREFFGLLVHAHYRTTPSDLQRLLDAPNLQPHALLCGDRLVAATLIAREGRLPDEMSEDMARGRLRIRGHALPDTLISHSGRREVGPMEIIRSVRIAVHPELRRRGLGTRLIEAIHATYTPDFFGTIFGVTPELLRFRRAAGYELIRVGASRGVRTGEPSAVMMRPVSPAARRLFDALREDLARDLPLQLELQNTDGELALEPALEAALGQGLAVDPKARSTEARDAIVSSYAHGPRTYESAATPLTAWVRAHRARLSELEDEERFLIEARILERRSWSEVARLSELPSVPAAMRALRRAIRALAS